MKKLVLLSALSFIFCKSFSQSIMLSNDSVSLKIIPVKCFNGDVKGFTFELSNNSYNKIYTGINQSEKVICYTYKVGNMLLILCGGVPPGLYDFHPKSLNL